MKNYIIYYINTMMLKIEIERIQRNEKNKIINKKNRVPF